jgi:acyl-coenzyme A synthetase/AMP-(fatty) acid ligase
MNIFMEKFIENVKNDNGEPILFYGDNEGLTYSKINELSGKVLTFLRSGNIGKEDFVLVNLPRGVEPIICMIGVWKAGAAFVVVEENNCAPEREQFIREDCKCKAEIGIKEWEEILKADPSDDIASPDEHDVAYATYTSGTTGKPKGILQEYGSIRQCFESTSYNGKPIFWRRSQNGSHAAAEFCCGSP